MKKPPGYLAAARRILAGGIGLLLAVVGFTRFHDERKRHQNTLLMETTVAESHSSMQRVLPSATGDVPPWETARHSQDIRLPEGAIAFAEVSPPPPDRTAPTPPTPVEPPNPATHPMSGTGER